MAKDYYKNRICSKCRYFYPEERGWHEKCLKHGTGTDRVSNDYLRSTVFPKDECIYFRPPFVSHDEDTKMRIKQAEEERILWSSK